MKNLLSLLILFHCCNSFAQSRHLFNSPGNVCYFEFVNYAPNKDYTSHKRPFIFILGKSGEQAMQTFENDTLRKVADFFNYQFIYLPNKGGDASNKLECVEALASLVTHNYEGGKSNLFLQVCDDNISQTDITSSRLNSLFKTVRLSSSVHDLIAKERPNRTLVDDFKETEIVSAPKIGEEEEDKYGTFYEEGENKKDSSEIPVNAQKVYFGVATMFNYVLTGIIRDKSTGEALPFATIRVKGTTNGASTNADGYFTLLKVPTDTSVLLVKYIGYDETEIYLTPSLPKRNFTIQLLPSTHSLKRVTIIGHKEDVVLVNKNEVSTIKMTPKKLEQLPNVGERDIMRSFQLMPGVSASNESSSGLYVRGGTPDQNLVLYDGFTVYQVDHLYGFFSAFNSNAIKEVQLYKGGFESKFGGRLSSVTEITGKEGNQNKWNMGLDLSLLSMNAFLEVPIRKKFTSIIAFRRSYKGPIYNKIFKQFNTDQTSSPKAGPGGRFSQTATASSYFYDLNGKFTYKPNERDILSLSIFNGTDNLDNSISTSPSSFGPMNTGFNLSSTDLTKYGNIGGSLKWSRKWKDKLYGNTILSYSNYYSNRNRSQDVTITKSTGETSTRKTGIFEDNNLKDFSLKSDYQLDLLSFSQLQFGVFATYYDIKYTYAQNDTSTILDRHNTALFGGAYIQDKLMLFKDRVQLLPGLRTSYFQSTDKVYYEPRVSLCINITDKLTLKGATGQYYQFANRVTREDILSGSKDFWILSDGNKVPVSSAVHYITGLSYENSNYLFSAEGYYKKLDGLTQYSLRINSSPFGVNYNENFFSGYGYSKGIEFLAQKKSGNFNGWICYTLGQARSHFTAFSDTYFPSDQDVTHEFKIVSIYKYKRWDFSATWIYATGRPYTAPSGAYSVTLLDGSTQSYFTVTAKNGLRLPEYHRMDISANYKLLNGFKGDKRRKEIGYIGFSIFNLYDRKNVWYKQYTIVSNQIIETNINYLGITPNITLSLKLR
jgi:hypothetical protein